MWSWGWPSWGAPLGSAMQIAKAKSPPAVMSRTCHQVPKVQKQAQENRTTRLLWGLSHVGGGYVPVQTGQPVQPALDRSGAEARGVACSNLDTQLCATTFRGPEGWRGIRWVGRSAAGSRGGGGVGTPTCVPQNDPHDALIIWNIHNWGK